MTTKFILPIESKVLGQLEDVVLFINHEGRILWENQAAQNFLSNSHSSFEKSINQYFDFDLLKEHIGEAITLKRKDDQSIMVDVKMLQVDQGVYGLILKNLTYGDQTRTVKKDIKELLNMSSEGMVIFNKEKIIDCDLEFAALFGYSQKEIRQVSFNQLIGQKELDEYIQAFDHYSDRAIKLIGVRKDQTTFNMELFYHPYNCEGTMMHIAFVKDITQQVKHEEQLEYMAYYDELTHLPNRNYFIMVLEDAIKSAKENNELLSVSFVDLDYFKEINETLGYDFGDQLLKICGEKFNTFKTENIFIARMGGDEFLILQRSIKDKNISIQFAKDLIQEFEKPIHIADYDVFLSISVGISIYPKNGETSDDLIKHANSAMYVIKERHRNNYNLFESSISNKFKMMLTMEQDLRKALTKKQFELHYQPQKCLHTNEVVGMEALLRWKHPINGYIKPMDFIPLAEKTGLIIEIGDWVLQEACRQNKAWQDSGYQPITMSVNLSVKQFHQQNLLEKIKQTLKATRLAPKYLELEVTESMAMTNEAEILKTMHHIRELGVHVSIDDFGTGYSSLKYLSMFPVTKLKIDKMFMDKSQHQNEAIVKSIIKMSHSLNMKVIAEGVETKKQLSFLKQENCDEVQGYYFSKPLPPNQLTEFL